MYHSLSMREGRSSSCNFEKFMAGRRREGSEPGRFASSTLSCSSVSLRRFDAEGVEVGREAEGARGWEILFWPVMWVPSDKETLMW